MSLKLYIVGRERRREQAPTDRERRAYEGAAGFQYVGLPDKTVSRRHAVIYVTDKRIYLRDLGSRNGTFVLEDGHFRRFTEGYLDRDQTLRFGRYRCQLGQLLEPQDAG